MNFLLYVGNDIAVVFSMSALHTVGLLDPYYLFLPCLWNRSYVLRKCENNQVFYRKGDAYPYCKNACEARTMCGEVQVPEHHLEVRTMMCLVYWNTLEFFIRWNLFSFSFKLFVIRFRVSCGIERELRLFAFGCNNSRTSERIFIKFIVTPKNFR